MLEDAGECTRRQVVAWLACDRDQPRLDGVLELSVATALARQDPSVVLDQPQNLTDLRALPSA